MSAKYPRIAASFCLLLLAGSALAHPCSIQGAAGESTGARIHFSADANWPIGFIGGPKRSANQEFEVVNGVVIPRPEGKPQPDLLMGPDDIVHLQQGEREFCSISFVDEPDHRGVFASGVSTVPGKPPAANSELIEVPRK